MNLIKPQFALNLINADQIRIFAFIAEEVGMETAKRIANRVVSDEQIPKKADSFFKYG